MDKKIKMNVSYEFIYMAFETAVKNTIVKPLEFTDVLIENINNIPLEVLDAIYNSIVHHIMMDNICDIDFVTWERMLEEIAIVRGRYRGTGKSKKVIK